MAMRTSLFRFDNWFAPLDFDEFRRGVLGRELLCMPPRPELAEHLMGALRIRSVDELLALRGAQVHAWFQKPDGVQVAALVPSTSARHFYDEGYTLYLTNVEDFTAHEHDVARIFGVPRSSVAFTLFCNRPDATTRGHFDSGEILVIQLKGRKTWRLAPNAFAPMPLRAWAPDGALASELRLSVTDAPPSAMPEGGVTHVLEAGSVLHMPRGYWHETSSDQDSMSLHIQIATPTRLAIMQAALKNELARDEWWRQPAYDLRADDPGAIGLAAKALASLRDAASRLDARDLVRAPVGKRAVGSDTRFVRSGQVSLGIDAVDAENEIAHVGIVSFLHHHTKVARLELSLEFVSACKWINALATGTVFGVPEVLVAAPTLDRAEDIEMLGVLQGSPPVPRPD